MKIKSPAVLLKFNCVDCGTDVIITGKNHGECLQKIRKMEQQGFITEDGIFVDRKTALDIARKAGQIKDEGLVRNNIGLMSEDLKEIENGR